MQKIAQKIQLSATWPPLKNAFHKFMSRTVLEGKGWILIIVWLAVTFILTNFILPRLNPPGLNIYVIQPTLWLAITGVILWLWKIETQERLFPINRKAIGLASLIGLFQVAVFVLSGLFFGFGNSPYAHRIDRVLLNLWFFGSQLIGLEMSRWYLAHSLERRLSQQAFTVTWLIMMIMMIPAAAYLYLDSPLAIFRFIGRTLLPLGASNLFAMYLIGVGGPLASIAYYGINMIFELISPILPNLTWTIQAFVGTIIPILGLALVNPLLSEHTTTEPAEKNKTSSLTSWAVVALLFTLLLWFRVGLFGIQPSLVSGPSMTPTLVAGDIIITRVVPIEAIQIGDIIRFRQGKADVVHRVIDIQKENGQITFITKGDYNNVNDPPVSPGQVEGKVIMVIPKVGWIAIIIRRAVSWLF
jgi:signal peptidase